MTDSSRPGDHAQKKVAARGTGRKGKVKGNNIKMNYYSDSIEDVLSAVESRDGGLTQQEAEERLAKNGKNKLAEKKKVPLIVRFFKEMADPMILVLIAAAAISLVTAIINGEGFADVIIIMTVVIINAILGVY